jgi:3-oxoacyl-(acyl-carrier-protein) synthase III
MGIRISGIGAYVPQRVVTNDELTSRLDTSNEWIVNKTGIRARRIAASDEAPSDMGTLAALQCLSNARLEKADVDLIVVACATPDQSQPAVACMIQERLGIAESRCPAFDVNSVCAGFVFALNVAQSMLLADPTQFRNALVIGTDAFSKVLNWEDRRTCIFFGDGAGAVLLTRTEGDEQSIAFKLGSDGRGRRCIEVPAGGTRMPVTAEVLAKRLNTFMMQGSEVWQFALHTVPEVIRDVLRQRRLAPSDLDLVVLHQSNLRMIEALMQALELPMDRTVTTIEEYGNTAAASIPIALHKAWQEGRLVPGSRVALCGFGGGLSWGAALLEW